MRFTAELELHGRTATGITVPADVVQALGGGTRPPVRVSIGAYSYRTTVAPRGGVFLVPVSAEHRAGAGVAAGDVVEVDLEVDTEPRTVTVPADLQAALDADPQAGHAFKALSYSNQQRHVLAVQGAKTEQTRQRRLSAVLTSLQQ